MENNKYLLSIKMCFCSFVGVMLSLILGTMLLSSCSSSKSSLKSNMVAETTFSSNIKDSVSTKKVVSIISNDSTIEDIEAEITNYDTSKPVDKNTGKPPISSITKTKTHKVNNKNNHTNINADKEETSVSTKAKDSKSISNVVQNSQHSETTIPKQISGIIWALSALCVIIIAGYLIYKYKKIHSI